VHNTTNAWDAAIVAVPAFLGFLTSLIAAYMGFQNQIQIRAATGKVAEVHEALNGKLAAAVAAAHAAGVAEERANGLQKEVLAAREKLAEAAAAAADKVEQAASRAAVKVKTVDRAERRRV
jgi:hypothetical protein